MTITYGKPNGGPYYNSDWYAPVVIFECGHSSEERAVVMSLYHRVSAGLGVGSCLSCTTAQRKQEHQTRAQELVLQSVAASLESGLQPLTGSREQVEQAERARAEFFRAFDKGLLSLDDPLYTASEREEALEILEAVRAESKEQTEATWWLASPPQLSALCAEALARLREMQPKDSTRFAPVTCEHPNPSYLFGLRQKRICEACEQQRLQRRRELAEKNKPYNIAALVARGLPVLEGPDNKVLRAERLRDKFINAALGIEHRLQDKATPLAICMEALQQNQAQWWLDQPYQSAREGLYNHLKAQRAAEAPKKKKTTKAKAEADPLELPVVLIGSEKQVAWANKLREKFLGYLKQLLFESTNPIEQKKARRVRRTVVVQSSAVWWIDSASREDPARHLREMMQAIVLEE